MFFSFSPRYGFCTHESAEQAKQNAQEALDEYADEAGGQLWDEEVTEVCWGKIEETTHQTMRRPVFPGENPDADEIVEYGLMP